MKRICWFYLLVAVFVYGQNKYPGSGEVQDYTASRSIDFAGYHWLVKGSMSPVGPGPNYFSDGSENVWVDSLDNLHLRITVRDHKWYCAEVILQESLGYGTYVFNTTSRIGAINENIVLGLFTWDTSAPNEDYREIDIEFARWGDAHKATNAQYVVQPYFVSGNLQRWYMPVEQDSSTHIIDWHETAIDFKSLNGIQKAQPFDSLIFEWNYFGQHFTQPGNENIRINLWLQSGLAPSDSQEQEIVISGFTYIPENPDALDQTPPHQPRQFTLRQNYPNPFGESHLYRGNSATVIEYDLYSAGKVTLNVYNLTGKKVATLVDGFRQSGLHKVIFDAEKLVSGIYFYTLKKDGFVHTKKMILVR